jgi:ubiquinol-cytochrome c reductase cytochrome b subunit
LFAVAAVLALLGGLFQINAVWLYGPFDPTVPTSPAQPDWYVGWLEGALRLAPAFEPELFGWRLPEPFIPGVLVPGVFFTVLALWPFIERRLTHDHAMHHLLDRPRDHPMRSGVGAAGVAFISVLTLAGSNDLLAKMFEVSVEGMNAVMQVLLIAGPVVAGAVTNLVCRELARREYHPVRRPRRMRLRRTSEGGFAVEPLDGPGGEPSSHALAHQADRGEQADAGPDDE